MPEQPDPAVALHPWNGGDFAWQPAHRPLTQLSEAEAARFDQDGFFVLRGALDDVVVDRVRAETDAFVHDHDTELAAKGGRAGISEKGAITFVGHLVARSVLLAELARHPVLTGVCHDLIGPDVNLYWDQAVYKDYERPRRFPWHQDNGYTFVLPQQYLTCWIPLVAVTMANGCPQVVPGLHRLGTLQHHYVDPLGWECFAEAPRSPVAVALDPGDVLVFSSLAPHLTGPNTTTAVRKAYILQYAPLGARILEGDPLQGPPRAETLCDQPDRHVPILRDGRTAS